MAEDKRGSLSGNKPENCRANQSWLRSNGRCTSSPCTWPREMMAPCQSLGSQKTSEELHPVEAASSITATTANGQLETLLSTPDLRQDSQLRDLLITSVCGLVRFDAPSRGRHIQHNLILHPSDWPQEAVWLQIAHQAVFIQQESATFKQAKNASCCALLRTEPC